MCRLWAHGVSGYDIARWPVSARQSRNRKAGPAPLSLESTWRVASGWVHGEHRLGNELQLGSPLLALHHWGKWLRAFSGTVASFYQGSNDW